MEENNERNELKPIEEPILIEDETEPELVEEAVTNQEAVVVKTNKPKRPRGYGWLVALISLVIIGLAILFGYRNGVQRRLQNERNMLMDQISVQLEWVYKDMDAERYENAKTRLEYIIDKYPNFPGASDLLVEVMMHMDAPTPAPTQPVVVEATEELEQTPTPDGRASEEIFNQIVTNIANEEWDQAIQNVSSLKETNYDFKTVEVDGYYFIALRNRGIQRIWAGELEQGMYDLSVAAQLGAIDSVAAGAISWASLYMTGASYWDVNWPGAVEIFSQLYAQMPYFSDSTGMTSAERYRIALYRLGDQFAMNGDYCTASNYYKQSLEVGVNLDIQVTATWLAETCANPPGESTPEPPTDPNPTEIPTEPPVEPTPEPPVGP